MKKYSVQTRIMNVIAENTEASDIKELSVKNAEWKSQGQ